MASREAGYAEFDPSGLDRSFFRQVAAQAAEKFMVERDLPAATDVVETLSAFVNGECGESHFDIGRCCTLMSIFFTMRAEYEMALQLALTGSQVLKPLGVGHIDYDAALFLKKELASFVAGTWSRDRGAIIDKGNPAGKFLFDLNPCR